MKINLLIACIISSAIFYNTQAKTLKSNLSYDVYSIDFNKKTSKKIKIELADLNYSIPIKSTRHLVKGFIEFDSSYLMGFRSRTQNSRYLETDEISEIISTQIDQTRLEMNLKQKYFNIVNNNFDRHILVEILDIERLRDNHVRCHFNAQLEFPIQVKPQYQNLNKISTVIKFKFKANNNNFFSKSKTTKLNLNLYSNKF